MTIRPVLLSVLAVAALGTATSAATAAKPRVTVIGDSIQASFDYVTAAKRRLGAGLDLRVDAKVCRRLASYSCPYNGVTPLTALQTIRALGPSLGGTIVMNVGYNDDSPGTSGEIAQIVQAAKGYGVKRIVWVTLREQRSDYSAINAVIRSAPKRFPEVVVADWNAASRGKTSWFGRDGLHLTSSGAMGLATLLRPLVVSRD